MKRNMDKKSAMVQLFENKLLRSKVDEALDTGKLTYEEIVELAKEYDVEISVPTISRYKARRQEAIDTGVPLEDLIDKRANNGNVIHIQHKKDTSFEDSPLGDNSFGGFDDSMEEEKVYSDIQVLDEMIQKGYNALKYTDVIGQPQLLKAIELRDKLTGGQMRGLSIVGLRELRLRFEARTEAITAVALEYIPEDKHEEVFDAMVEAEKEFYANLDLTEEDRKISEALEAIDLD